MTEPLKTCAHCKADFPRTEEFFQPKISGGWYSYCRSCVNLKSRAYFHQKQNEAGTTFVAQKEGKPLSLALHLIRESGERIPTARGTLTCLQCRNCILERDTDWRSKMPMIYCNKSLNENGGFGQRRMACLSGCGIADTRPQKPRKWRRFWVKYGPIGDRVQEATPALLAYLQTNWTRLHWQTLEKQTGRSIGTLRSIVLLHGIAEKSGNRAALSGGAQRNERFLVAQRELIARLYIGPDWPDRLSNRFSPPRRAKTLAARARIVERVNAIPHPAGVIWSWKQIESRAQKNNRRNQ